MHCRLWTLLCTLLLACQAQAQTLQARLTVKADQPGSVIDPGIYGQFAEHLGRGIYEGIWVGEDSPIPNTRGFRNDVVAALKELGVPVLRWPGGCFADEYHWRDGIGPRDQRPKRINTMWGAVTDDNAFGTHEFMDFAELIGAEVYVNGNVGTGSTQEMAEWVEYMTGIGDSGLAQLRRSNGRDEPWRLHYFAVGNETWGCGGNMRPEFYADLYRQYATFLKSPSDNKPKRIASGANASDTAWTEVLMREATKHMDAISVHYYTLPRGDWKVKGKATGFPESEWISTMARTLRMDEILTNHIQIMDKYDPQKRVALLVDEWGTWYDVEPGTNPGFLYQQNSLRDALVAAVNLNIFHRHAERVRMTNIAQMINVLQAMILTEGPKMVRTPTYHAFAMYKPFRGATHVPVDVTTPEYRLASDSVPAVHASAARDKSGRLHVAITNLDPHRRASIELQVSGHEVDRLDGQLLTAPRMDTINSFDSPDVVRPTPFKPVSSRAGKVKFELPSKSVLVLSQR